MNSKEERKKKQKIAEAYIKFLCVTMWVDYTKYLGFISVIAFVFTC